MLVICRLILFTILNFCGYVIRDGWPSWKENLIKWGAPSWLIHLSTQLARFSGAIPCGIGAYIFTQNLLFSFAFFVSTWGDYYLDQKHGEGQSATNTMDAVYLGISGISSMCLYGILYLTWWDKPWLIAVAVGTGLLKIGIWFADWRIFLAKDKVWAQPTRMSAGFFGAIIALVTAGIWYYV